MDNKPIRRNRVALIGACVGGLLLFSLLVSLSAAGSLGGLVYVAVAFWIVAPLGTIIVVALAIRHFLLARAQRKELISHNVSLSKPGAGTRALRAGAVGVVLTVLLLALMGFAGILGNF